MPSVAQIAAARQYAPPLITTLQVDRRGARLRTVNQKALDYAQRAGLSLTDVYPGWQAQLYMLGQAPDVDIAGEAPATGRKWGWAAAGFAVGAMAVGPIWALAGAALGALR